MREEFLVPAARNALAALPLEDRVQIERIIHWLCTDQRGASLITTLADDFPTEVYRYTEGGYTVTLDLPDDATLRVWMIAKIER